MSRPNSNGEIKCKEDSSILNFPRTFSHIHTHAHIGRLKFKIRTRLSKRLGDKDGEGLVKLSETCTEREREEA